MADLEPCKVCGSTRVEIVGPDAMTHIFVKCLACGARGLTVIAAHGGSIGDAVASWNNWNRLPQPQAGEPTEAMVEAAARVMARDVSAGIASGFFGDQWPTYARAALKAALSLRPVGEAVAWDVLSWIDTFDPETIAAAETKFGFSVALHTLARPVQALPAEPGVKDAGWIIGEDAPRDGEWVEFITGLQPHVRARWGNGPESLSDDGDEGWIDAAGMWIMEEGEQIMFWRRSALLPDEEGQHGQV